MASRIESVAGFILWDIAGSIVRFPIWWYGPGLLGVVGWAKDGLVYRWRSYALGLWIRHFFTPMYGAYDWTGRLISILVRFVVILGRLFVLLVETLVYLFILFLWVLAPLFFVGMFLANALHTNV